jgi:ASC-1-like (ASCH) protein
MENLTTVIMSNKADLSSLNSIELSFIFDEGVKPHVGNIVKEIKKGDTITFARNIYVKHLVVGVALYTATTFNVVYNKKYENTNLPKYIDSAVDRFVTRHFKHTMPKVTIESKYL